MKRPLKTSSLLRAALLVAPLMIAAPAWAQSSNATISQIGNGSTLSSDQSQAAGATIIVEQIGDAMRAALVQRDGAHKATVRMQGEEQTLNATQAGAGLNSLEIDMAGGFNSVTANQFAEAGGSNTALLSQNGIGNRAMIEQQAAVGQNYLTLAQNGNDNVAALSQIGGENQMDLTQNGDANTANLTQDGVGLILGIIQNGGATTTITQTGPGGGGG